MFKHNSVYLGIGSNLGDSKKNLEDAIKLIKENGIIVLKVAPFYYNPALLLQNASEEYNKPFCNTVILIHTDLKPEELLNIIKKIEIQMLRPEKHKKWSPREIDIDILLYEDGTEVDIEDLTIPHKEIFNRSFVLNPLSYMNSSLKINNKSVLLNSRSHKLHNPTLMGILNITDDSFSVDGKLGNIREIEKIIEHFVDEGIGIIDIGAESTRPNATEISQEEEIERLMDVFEIVNRYKNTVSTKFSIDTRNFKTAELAIKNNFTIINDVSNISDQKMLDLVKNNKSIEYVAMHSLSIPTNNNIILDPKFDIVAEMMKWSTETIEKLVNYGLDLNQIILDFGIGFGKTKNHSLQILQNFEQFNNIPCRILIGHSRKSFISIFSDQEAKNRDIETLAISLELKNKGIDILRVHEPVNHKRAILAQLHCQSQYYKIN